MSDENGVPAPIPAAPNPEDDAPAENWEYHSLYMAVRNAIYALPSYFRSELNISGIPVADLQNFNTSLGASIESQAVETLNAMRQLWDPDGMYANYTFIRQAQQFPDVILKGTGPDIQPQILMGIELKGWYVMSKEGEPSGRYKVTAAVCAESDLLVMVPWALSNVISGTPRLFTPYLASARFAAKYRNWHWQYKRQAQTDPGITVSTATTHYPTKSDAIQDRPLNDSGNNFGRYARAGLMDDYMAAVFDEVLYGIPLRYWQGFFKALTGSNSPEQVAYRLASIADDVATMRPALSEEATAEIRVALENLIGVVIE